jgi:ATP-binding cassette subfamily B protein
MQATQSPATIRDLLRYLKPYLWLTIVTVIFLILARVSASFEPVALKWIIDGVSAGNSLDVILGAVIAYFSFRAGTAVFDLIRDVVFAPAEMGIGKTLSEKLFTHLLRLPIAYHSDQRVGGLARKITRGGRAVTFILDLLVISILPTVTQLVVATIFLLVLYPWYYAAIIAGTVISYTWFTLWTTEKRQKYRVAANTADDEVAGVEVDALTSIETVKYFNNETYMLNRYDPAVTKRFVMSVASNRLFAVITSGQALILLLGLGAVLYLAIRAATLGELSVGDLVLLTTYLIQLATPVDMLGYIYRQIKDGLADLQGMAEVLAEPITITEPEQPVAIAKPKGKVEFENVTFAYAGRDPVLKDVSFTVEPGQRVAFVGPSGAGKSTIIKLLFRLYEPTSGRILIDGVPLDQLSKEDRARLFAIVPQEAMLFNASIAENIRFGDPDASDAAVAKAAELASIRETIERFPEQFETLVGERGVKLSGGEKQRVAIARAILRDPKILAFDEATSSLDTESERAIQGAIDAVAKGRTTVAVAHRLSTIRESDTIYVLNQGEIVEQGKHTTLVRHEKGLYARLWDLQARGKEEDETLLQ